MTEGSDLPVLDHELADDELAWVKSVYADFAAVRADFVGRESEFNAKEALREVLGRRKNALPTPMDLTGDGPWRGGRNRHNRLVTGVFLNRVELHRHEKSRTDQFPMYVVGEAEGFSVGSDQQPIMTPVMGGSHFHNAPDAPHAFVPEVGKAIPDDWEIVFIAITPRNLREDTQKVNQETKVLYQRATGYEAPTHV
jgi:hypothetical protein